MEHFINEFIAAIQDSFIDKHEASEIIKLIGTDNQEGIRSILNIIYRRDKKIEIDHLISLLPINKK